MMNKFVFMAGILVTLVSGFAESIGVTKTDLMWGRDFVPNFKLFLYAMLGFFGSILGYMISVKLFKIAQISAPEIHFSLWYLGSVIGIAIISKRFFSWPADAQIVAILIVAMVLWVTYRTGGG